MNQTVVGVFDTRERAQAASQDLEAQGFSRSAIRISDEPGPATMADADRDDTGFFESVGNFFGRMFGGGGGGGDDDEARQRHVRPYAEAVRRGHCVLRVDVADDESGDRAVRVLENAGAVDVDERMSQWFGQSSDTAAGDEAMVAGDSVAGNLYTPTEAAPGPSAVYKPVMGDTPEVVAESEARGTHHPQSMVGTASRGPVRVYPRDVSVRTGGGTASGHHDPAGFGTDGEGGSHDDVVRGYGRRLRADRRHLGRSWEEMEAEARSGWEREHQDRTRKGWDEVRDAVHYSWRDTTGPA